MKDEIKDAKWEKEEGRMVKLVVFSLSFLAFLIVLILGFGFMCGCTISFQNISTHGTATDLVDENQAASPSTNATIPINVSAVPKT